MFCQHRILFPVVLSCSPELFATKNSHKSKMIAFCFFDCQSQNISGVLVKKKNPEKKKPLTADFFSESAVRFTKRFFVERSQLETFQMSNLQKTNTSLLKIHFMIQKHSHSTYLASLFLLYDYL